LCRATSLLTTSVCNIDVIGASMVATVKPFRSAHYAKAGNFHAVRVQTTFRREVDMVCCLVLAAEEFFLGARHSKVGLLHATCLLTMLVYNVNMFSRSMVDAV